MKFVNKLVIIFSLLSCLEAAVQSSGDTQVDDLLGIRSAPLSRSHFVITGIKPLAKIVIDDSGGIVKNSFWPDAKKLAAETGMHVFEEYDQNLNLFDPPLRGTFYQGGSGPVALLAIAKTPTNNWVEAGRQTFGVLYWSDTRKKVIAGAMLIGEVETFSDLASIKLLGFFLQADPSGKPLNKELAQVTFDKIKATNQVESSADRSGAKSEKDGILVQRSDGTIFVHGAKAPVNEDGASSEEQSWSWIQVVSTFAAVCVLILGLDIARRIRKRFMK